MSSDEMKCPECGGSRGLARLLHDTDPPHECTDKFHSEEVVAAPEPEKPGKKIHAIPQPPQGTKLPPVICPHCCEAAGISGHMAIIRGIHVLVVACIGCRKMISVTQVLQMQTVEMPNTGAPV